MSSFSVMSCVVYGFVGAGAVLIYQVSRNSVHVSQRGIRFESKLKCPECQKPLPAFRLPRNMRQFLWGGWTCPSCGLEVDRHLGPIST